MMQVAAH
jgi:hypothetical protein